MGLSGISGAGIQFQQNPSSNQRVQIKGRIADIQKALQSAQTQNKLQSDVQNLLNRISSVFESRPGQRLAQVEKALDQFSVVLDSVDPAVLEGVVDDISGTKRRLKRPPSEVVVKTLQGIVQKQQPVAIPTSLSTQLVKKSQSEEPTVLNKILNKLRPLAEQQDVGAQSALAAMLAAQEMTQDDDYFREQYDTNIEAAQSGDVSAIQLVVQSSVALGIDPDLDPNLIQMGLTATIPPDLPKMLEHMDYGEVVDYGSQSVGKVLLSAAGKRAMLAAYYSDAQSGSMGAVTALSMVDWNRTAREERQETNPIPEKLRSFQQLVNWFSREVTRVSVGDVSDTLAGGGGDLFGAITPELKNDLEDLIKEILASGFGIKDLEELKQVMSLVGLLGFSIDSDLLSDIQDAVREFVEEQLDVLDIEDFVDFLQTVQGIVGPVLGNGAVETAIIPDSVRNQLSSGQEIVNAESVGDDDSDGVDGIDDEDEIRGPIAGGQDSSEDEEFETQLINIQQLQGNLDHIIRYGQSDNGIDEGTLVQSNSDISLSESSEFGSDDDREHRAHLDFSLSLEESVVKGFESTANQLLDVIGKITISNLEPKLDDILGTLDLSGVDLESLVS